MKITRRDMLKSAIAAAIVPPAAASAGVVVVQPDTSTQGAFFPLALSGLSGAGRIGFYVDYSELSTTGMHNFYVCRTHGSTGAVSVRYQSGGDAHTRAQGTLAWADGDISIHRVQVAVPTKVAGAHRMHLQLSDPTGGAALQFGATHTVAYGVIDDDTISSDAVFFDAAAAAGGTGTQASPYNSIYDAIANVGAARHLYGSGTVRVDGTNTATPLGASVHCIAPPTSRTNESDRLYIEQWPGRAKFSVQGTGTRASGFLTTTAGQGSWITYRGIDFSNLGGVNAGFACGIGYEYRAAAAGVNVELCQFENIDAASGSNTAGVLPWGLDGMKIWRSTANDIKVAGNARNNNSGGMVLTYDGKNLSIQRCRISNSAHGLMHKRIGSVGFDVSLNARFNHFIGNDANYSTASLTGGSHSYSIVQGNLFEGARGGIRHRTISRTNIGVKAGWWVGNAFDGCGFGETAAINTRMANGAIIASNIMYNCRKVWADQVNDSPGSDIEYANYNHEHGTTMPSQRYEWRGTNYLTAAALNAASGHEANSSTGDPGFRDANNGNYTLLGNSEAKRKGISGSDPGIYLTGIERIGP